MAAQLSGRYLYIAITLHHHDIINCDIINCDINYVLSMASSSAGRLSHRLMPIVVQISGISVCKLSIDIAVRRQLPVSQCSCLQVMMSKVGKVGIYFEWFCISNGKVRLRLDGESLLAV